MANELDGIKRLLRASPEDPNIVQEQDWDELVDTMQAAIDLKAPVASPKFQTRVDIAAASFSASFRDDGAGNLGWYVGAAAAADGAQTEAVAIDPATGNVGIGTSLPGSNKLSVAGNIRCSGEVFGAGEVTYAVLAPDSATGSASFIARGSGSGYNPSGLELFAGGFERIRVLGAGTVQPGSDNGQSFGAASVRWSVIYAATGTINTSDAREKIVLDGEDITQSSGWRTTPPTEAELRVARRLAEALGWFKFKGAVAAKGLDGARRHFGLTVQFALHACEAEDVDPWAIGIFCRDEVTRKVKVTRIVTEQKTEPAEPALVIDIIDGVPTQVLRGQPDRPVFEMKSVIGLDGQVVVQGGQPLQHPVPVMIEVEREVEVDEPAGVRLGFRQDQLALFLLAGLVGD